VKVGVAHGFGVVDCSAADNALPPIPLGCYKGVSWEIGYNSTVITTSLASIVKNPAAPAFCNLKALSSVGAGSHVLAACYESSPSGVPLNYSGDAWNITFTCVAGGTVQLPLILGFDTFVFDGIVNLPFHTHGDSVTCLPDTDGDGMGDAYEQAHACLNYLVADSTGDPDGDGLTSLQESGFNSDPCSPDPDADGMPDGYETAHACLNPNAADAGGNPDGDEATNIQEMQWGGDPCVFETRYQLSIDAPIVGLVGVPHSVALKIDQNGLPPYQAVQWKVQYDPAKVTYLGGSWTGAAVTAFGSCSGPVHINPTLVQGCLKTFGTTDFTGTGFTLDFQCSTTGTANYTLIELIGGGAETFVKIGTTSQLFRVTVEPVPCKADSDGDGMPDDFEAANVCLNAAVADAGGDPDADTLTSITEFNASTNPCNADTDADTMPDGYEVARACLNAAVADGAADPDADGLTNVIERALGTDPCAADTDGDAMTDGYEAGCTNPLVNDAGGDADGDTLANVAEFGFGTNACSADTDADTMPDAYEVVRSCLFPATADGAGDPDADASTNVSERAAATDPCDADTDNDGLNDGAEAAAGTNPLLPDTDGDGLLDGAEIALGTSPLNTDSDADTLLDGAEVNDGTNPLIANPDPADADDDNDGCTDVRESGVDHIIGGQRNPLNRWDFYDVNGTGSIGLSDTLLILSHFGHGPGDDLLDDELDRYVPDTAQPWRTAEADNGIGLLDALVNLQSFGNNCNDFI